MRDFKNGGTEVNITVNTVSNLNGPIRSACVCFVDSKFGSLFG